MCVADFWTSDLNQKVKKHDQDLDQHHNSPYWYVSPVLVERFPDIDLNPSSTCTHDIIHQNITSSPHNGEAPQTIGPEVKGQIQNKPGKEMKYKRPPPRPPSLSFGSALFISAPSLSQSSSFMTQATQKKEEGKGGGGEKEERKLMLISPPPPKPPVFLQSRVAPPLPPAPLRCTSCRKSTDHEVGEGTGREKEQNPAKKIQKEEGGESGKEKTRRKTGHLGEVVEQENSNQQQEEEVRKKHNKKKEDEKEEEEVTIKKEEDKNISQSQCPSLPTKPFRPVPPPRKKPLETPVCLIETTEGGIANGKNSPRSSQMRRPDVSLYSPQGGAALGTEPDSCSTSSTEEEIETLQQQEQSHK